MYVDILYKYIVQVCKHQDETPCHMGANLGHFTAWYD